MAPSRLTLVANRTALSTAVNNGMVLAMRDATAAGTRFTPKTRMRARNRGDAERHDEDIRQVIDSPGEPLTAEKGETDEEAAAYDHTHAGEHHRCGVV